jgi:hypothetical protein
VRNLDSPNREKTRKPCLGRVSIDLASKYGPDARQRSSVPASAAGMDRRSLLTKRRSACALKQIILSPDDTPPRRLVLKMIDLQEALTDLNGKVMSGLAVKPEAWDSITELITRLERNFREDIIFSWRKPILPERTDEEGNQTGGESGTAGNDVVEGTSETAIAPPRRTKSINNLARLEKEFKKVVDVRDRKYQTMTYSDVFIGTDAVDAIVYAGLAGTREEGVELGRALARERRLFKHVTNEHSFEDKHYFYHYNDRDDDSLSSLEEEDGVSASMFISDVLETGGFASEMKAFKDAVGIRDRKYRMKLYPKVFVGSGTFLFELFLGLMVIDSPCLILTFAEAVDSLVYNGVAKTRWEAVQFGRKLARELRLFEHVVGDHEFRDSFLFYHYREDAIHTSFSGSIGEISEEVSNLVPQRRPLAEKADAFRMYVDVRDRRYRMQSYHQCFVGSGKFPCIF